MIGESDEQDTSVMAGFLAHVETSMAQGDGWMELHELVRQDAGARIHLRIIGEEPTPQWWEVRCRSLHAWQAGRMLDRAEMPAEHVLLAPFRERSMVLGIKGAVRDVRLASADLYSAHERVTGGWFPFGAFFNGLRTLAELLTCGAAELASGPRTVIEAYATALAAHGAEVYVMREGTASFAEMRREFWNEPGRIDVLILGRHTWFVGVDFSAAEVTP